MSTDLSRDLELLTDLFTAGDWREVRVESNGLSVLLSTDAGTVGLGGSPAPNPPRLPRPQGSSATSAAFPSPGLLAAPPHDTPATPAIAPSWRAVTAPNLGTFYRSPKPGSPPFVTIGQRVSADSEICLIEVMKLFTSVKAGVAGIVRRIDATDAELVEGGQTLFHIEPE